MGNMRQKRKKIDKGSLLLRDKLRPPPKLNMWLGKKLKKPDKILPYVLPMEKQGGKPKKISKMSFDPDVSKLHPEAIIVYHAANNAYRQRPGRQFSYIEIHSGYRTIALQAELYDAYMAAQYGGTPANQANKPGKSLHNYGLAIDIVRGSDEDNLRPALENNGWKGTVKTEAWHFDAVGAKGFSDIIKHIQTKVHSTADKYGNSRSDYYAHKAYIDRERPLYLAEKQRLSVLRPPLVARRRAIAAREATVKRQQAHLRQDFRSIEKDRKRLVKFRAIAKQSFKNSPKGYTCTNGYDYDDCNHKNIKKAWRKRRKEYAKRASELSKIIGQRQADYRQTMASVKKDAALLKRDRTRYRRDLSAFNKLVSKNKKHGKNISRNIRLKNKANGQRAPLLKKLLKLTEAIRKG